MRSTDARAEAEALVKEGAALYGQGELERALRCWKQALVIEPGNAAAAEYLKFIEAHFKVSVDALLERYHVSTPPTDAVDAEPSPAPSARGFIAGEETPVVPTAERARQMEAARAGQPVEGAQIATPSAPEPVMPPAMPALSAPPRTPPPPTPPPPVPPPPPGYPAGQAAHLSSDAVTPVPKIPVPEIPVPEIPVPEISAEGAAQGARGKPGDPLGIIETEADFESLDWSVMLDQEDAEVSIDIHIPEPPPDPMAMPVEEFSTPESAQSSAPTPPPTPKAHLAPEDSVWGQVEVEYGKLGEQPDDAELAQALNGTSPSAITADFDAGWEGATGPRSVELLAGGEPEVAGLNEGAEAEGTGSDTDSGTDSNDELSALFAPLSVDAPGEGSIDDPFVDTGWANLLPRTPSPKSGVQQTLDGPFGLNQSGRVLDTEDSGTSDVIADMTARGAGRERALVSPPAPAKPPMPMPPEIQDLRDLPDFGDVMPDISDLDEDAAPPSPEEGASLNEMAAEMERLHEAGEYIEAFEMAERLLNLCPGHPRAEGYLSAHGELLKATFQVRLGPLDHCPKVLMGPDQIIWQSMDHRAGFLFSQADGMTSYEDIIAISGMSELEATRLLVQLVDLNVIG